MNRSELIHKMQQLQGVRLDVGEGKQTYISKDEAVKLVQKSKEHVPCSEKVCIPHFVATYIKKCKEYDNTTLYQVLEGRDGLEDFGYKIDTRRWLEVGGDDSVEKFARAWVNENLIEIEEEYNVTTSDGLEVQKIFERYRLGRRCDRVEGVQYTFDKEIAEALAVVFDGVVNEYKIWSN